MSEIKITKNSIENGIISNGQVTIGSIDNTDYGNSNIVSNSSGSMAIGYIDSVVVDAEDIGGAIIKANNFGSFASGYAFIENDSRGDYILTYHNVIANDKGSHAEGCGTNAAKLYSHAEGYDTIANGLAAHSEGAKTYAGLKLVDTPYHIQEIAYGYTNRVILQENIVDGYFSVGQMLFINNHIFTINQIIKSAKTLEFIESIGESDAAWANDNSIMLIDDEYVAGDYAHAEGYKTTATGSYSHAGGIGTIANKTAMTAIGKYNVSTNTANTLFVVGDGTPTARSDAFRVNTNGSSTTSPSSVQAKVNGVSDVYLGCPIGTVVMWAGETAPEGWLLCNSNNTLDVIDGDANDYDFYVRNPSNGKNYYYKATDLDKRNLCKIIKNTYGISDGTMYEIKQIRLPNFSGLFPVGVGTGTDANQNTQTFQLGLQTQTGEYKHTLTKDEMPSHSHDLTLQPKGTDNYPSATGASGQSMGTQSTSTSGKSHAHNNIPPYLAINFIIKYK